MSTMANGSMKSVQPEELASRCSSVSKAVLHFLLLPLATQGHMNPMLALAERLLAAAVDEGGSDSKYSVVVTCVLTGHSRASTTRHRTLRLPGLRFVSLPDRLDDSSCSSHAPSSSSDATSPAASAPPPSPSPVEAVVVMLNAMKQQQGFIEGLILASKDTDCPISCLISDFTFPWTQDVADNCGIPRAVLWTCSASHFYVASAIEATAGGIYPGAHLLQELRQQGLQHFSAESILGSFYREDPREMEVFMGIFQRLGEASHVLVNTFRMLEGQLLPLLPPTTRFIGPCLPLSASSENRGHHRHHHHHHQALRPATADPAGPFESVEEDDMACLNWLDQQEDRSVLFISFGTMFSLPQAQIHEIALGLESSNHKFLWVARHDRTHPHHPSYSFPEGFLHNTKDRGLVISWAPQLRVLAHAAVGGFLTHCGWNSTLESIYMGVPMICFPIEGDQPLNEETIIMHASLAHGNEEPQQGNASATSVGLGFEGRRIAGLKSDYIVSRQEVEEVVRAMLDGGDTKTKLKDNSSKLMVHARHAWDPKCGSSYHALGSFIEDIHHLSCL